MTALSLYLTAHPLSVFVITVVLGLVVGSFLNVVIHRLPIMLERQWRADCQAIAGPSSPPDAAATAPDHPYNLMVPRSRCPHCNHAISALENIPILSFIWLRGRCSACSRTISWRYPVVETLSAVLCVVVVWRFGASSQAVAALVFTWYLVALGFIDFDRQILPDAITLLLLWLGLLVNLFDNFVPLRSAVIGAMAGYISLWLVFQLFKFLTGKEGMGYGDFKLLAALGAWLGWQGLPLTILLASILGAGIGLAFILFFGHDRRQPIPFGPFLCFGGWVTLLWGDPIMRYYLQFTRF